MVESTGWSIQQEDSLNRNKLQSPWRLCDLQSNTLQRIAQCLNAVLPFLMNCSKSSSLLLKSSTRSLNSSSLRESPFFMPELEVFFWDEGSTTCHKYFKSVHSSLCSILSSLGQTLSQFLMFHVLVTCVALQRY